MNPEHARELLERRKDELRQIVRVADERRRLDADLRAAGGETPTTEPAELASETLERELDQTIREAAEASLQDVEHALRRLEKGTYGVCPVCGGAIDEERLEARPEAEYCVEHQPR